MKPFEFDYPWTTNREWMLPDEEFMMQGQFPILEEQVGMVLGAITKRRPDLKLRTCVQAGGAFGLYPLRLSLNFRKVWTFEPLSANLECLKANMDRTLEQGYIVVSPTALWHEEASLWMDYSKAVKNSYGAHHVSRNSYGGGERIEAEPLDDFDIDDLDLLWLDVEGAEAFALMGAYETIMRCKPVVVIEQRYLPQMQKLDVQPDSAARWLTSKGYREAGRTHGDVIYVPR